MESRRLRVKTICILLWLMVISAGLLAFKGSAGAVWQLVYDGIYETGNTGRTAGCMPEGMRQEVYRYTDYWTLEIKQLCESGEDIYGEPEDKAGQDASNEEGGEDSGEAVMAMADISSSYADMDFDTLLSYCYNVPQPACVADGELNARDLLGEDVGIDTDTGGYKVLIYHTHSSEAFADSREGEVSDTIIGVGNRLAELLSERYGIQVYHDTSMYDMMSGKLDRDEAYVYSREGVKQILEENPDIEVIIDLHRDGVPDSVHLVTEVDGRQTAQIMLVNGMSRGSDGEELTYMQNPNKQSNLALSLQLYLAGRANYGDLMRRIYLGTTRYNLDIMPHAALIEVGAQTNTVEEEMNAMEPLAAVIAKVLLD